MFSKIIDKFKSADFILVTISTVICSGLSFVFGVFAKKYVPPLEYGIYSTCLLAQTYMAYAQLGVFNAYNRDYPQALGRGDKADAAKMKSTALTFQIAIYMLVLVAFEIVVAIIYHGSFGSNLYAVGYALCPFIILIKSVDDFSVQTTRIHGYYNFSAGVGLIRTVLAMACGILAVKQVGYYGLYVMPIASSLISILLNYKKGIKGTKLSLDFAYAFGMIKSGMPLLINALIWTLVTSVDKFVILIFLTTEDLGIYSVPIMGFTAMVLVPQSLSQVFYNKMSILYGKCQDKKILLDKGRFYTMKTAVITAVACVMVYFIMPIFVEIFMPRYTDGTLATQILVVAVAIYSTTMLYSNIFSVVKLNKELIKNSLWLCLFNVIFSTSLVLLVGKNIEMVAVGTGVSYAVYSLLLMIKMSKTFDYSFTKLLTRSWGPMLLVLLPMLLFDVMISNMYIAMLLSLVVAGIVGLFVMRVKEE